MGEERASSTVDGGVECFGIEEMRNCVKVLGLSCNRESCTEAQKRPASVKRLKCGLLRCWSRPQNGHQVNVAGYFQFGYQPNLSGKPGRRAGAS